MDSRPSSSLRFLTRDGNPLDAPSEWAACVVELRIPLAHRGSVKLWRNEVALDVSTRMLGGKERVLAAWPRSGTGSYRLELECEPAAVNERRVVEVPPAKLTPEAYSQLLLDLEIRLPASIAVGLSRLGALTGVDVVPADESTFAQELVRVRRAVRGSGGRPGLRLVLEQLAKDPHRHLLSRALWTQRQRARRIDPARLPQIVVRGGNLAGGLPTRVPEIRVEHTTDNYENRLVRTFRDRLQQHIRHLGQAAKPHQRKEKRELKALERELAAASRQAGFLERVGLLPHPPDRVTMVLLERPAYRAALEGFLEFTRSAVARLDDPRLDAPLENLPSLYQTWGVLHVADVALEKALDTGYRVIANDIVRRDPTGLFVRILGQGRPALVFRHENGAVVRLTPQRRYGQSGPLTSIGFLQIPDVVLELKPPDGPASVFVFDPKYKLAGGSSGDDKPVKGDIDAMHAYRDAIRDGDGRRVVDHAAILYPGPEVRYDDGLWALRAHPLDTDALRARLGTAVERCFEGGLAAGDGSV